MTTADQLIATEVEGQNRMWGPENERADATKGQLMDAGLAQLLALYQKRTGDAEAFTQPPVVYPEGWAGFRDYGSDIANLVVAAAFIRQEIARKLRNGEDTTRAKRAPDQVFGTDQPKESFA